VPRVKQRTSELRAHVLRKAQEMLEREGVLAFTARRIASEADTSMPAVYELFGDKAGLVREVFFEGFRQLHARFAALPDSSDARGDLIATLGVFRAFAADHPVLAEVMFSRPFADFEPKPSELKAGGAVRGFIVRRVRRCIDANVLAGDEVDIAHVLLGLLQGLSAQERAGWLGTSRASVDRRFKLAIESILLGFAPR
jgi:AcrR family transcriptional regulator